MPAAVICDDDDVVRRVIRGMLADAGWDIVGEASRAIDAIDLLRVTQADVLVLDVALPGVNGIEAARVVHEVSEPTSIVLLSAFELTDEEVKEAGAAAALDKSQLSDLPEVLAAL